MRSILYVIAVILIIGWLIGQFGGTGFNFPSIGGYSLLHILLVLAIISLLLGFIRRGEV